MADVGHRRSHRVRRRKNPGMNQAWCCSLGVVLQSHENRTPRHDCGPKPRMKPLKPVSASSFHSSPSSCSKMSLGFMDPRRMLSPGRVSPIDSLSVSDLPPRSDPPAILFPASSSLATQQRSRVLTLKLKGKDGRCLELELDAEVLCRRSKFFAAMLADDRRKPSEAPQRSQKVEIAVNQDISAFKDTLELMMYEKDEIKYLAEAGVCRAIDMLEVSSAIMFKGGVASCLGYLEASPWSEHEEQKLKALFARRSFDDPMVNDILGRLYGEAPKDSQDLAMRLVRSVVNGRSNNARKELQALLNGLFSKSSVYRKNPCGLTKEALYEACNSCFVSLAESLRGGDRKQISGEVDNLNWLLDLLIDQQIAEDFVELWAKRKDLLKLHEKASPMVRYELSRISAAVFVAMGSAKLQCSGDVRGAVLRTWFGPLMADFGWMRRRRRNGLDLRAVEEATGQAILTLSLPEQKDFFVEWVARFTEHGTECPNLSRAFEVWWRRSFQTAADCL